MSKNMVDVYKMYAGSFVINDFYKLQSNKIKKVIYNDPCTIILWTDGTKTIVRCTETDVFDPAVGLALCLAKKFLSYKEYRETVIPLLCG